MPAGVRCHAMQQHDIRLIVSDVDGTLLNHKQELTPGVEAAVKAAAALGVPVRARPRIQGGSPTVFYYVQRVMVQHGVQDC